MRNMRAWSLLLLLLAATPAGAQQVVTSARPDRVAVTVYRAPHRGADEPLNLEWILADHAAGQVADEIGRSAFADARDADIGLDGYEQGALVERTIHAGMRPALHARNPGFGKRRVRSPGRPQCRADACGKRLQQSPAIHHRVPLSKISRPETRFATLKRSRYPTRS